MNKEPTILENTLAQAHDVYAPVKGDYVTQIQHNVAIGMLKGMIAMHRASLRARDCLKGGKTNGR